MAKKMIRPLRSERDYDAALAEIERYFDKEPQAGTPEADRFDLLALVIEDYERKHWPIDPPDPVDAIRYRMETAGPGQNDLRRLRLTPLRAPAGLGQRLRLNAPVAGQLSHHLHGQTPLSGPNIG